MKLLFVIDNLSTGGAQRQMVNLAIGLAARGYSIEVFCYASGDMLTQPLHEMGIPIHWHIKRSRFSSDVVYSLLKVVNQNHYNLVLSFLTTPNFYSILSTKLLRLRHIPVVISERFCDLPGEIGFIARFARQFYCFADHLVVNSHHQRINFEHKYPRLRSRISTIYNGYDLEYFAPSDSYSSDGSLKLLTIASVSRHKNGLCLIESLKIMRQQFNIFPGVTWIGQKVLAGDRLVYLKEMEAKIHEYMLESQWNWLGQRTDIVQQLQQHDVLMHPSYGEGLPNVVCEALSCACPVIVSNTLDHPRLVQDGHSGYLFNWQDPIDLAQKIKIFSELSLKERREMGLNGRHFAEQNLSISRYVDEYEQLFINIFK
jgi:GalNAc-alpha-(1->4)-GalNAc-alpha-(1->3)-diNAcBac-PP-undecaprenol alpha-1,4-N-acetyl-D-galactosaminyltransferase